MAQTNASSQVWAHRGWSSRYPENTLAAFQAALDLGVDGLELDVHLTKDQELVVMHDAKLDRTTNGSGGIRTHTLAELKALDAGSWFHAGYAGIGVPTLTEVFELLNRYPQSVQLNVELKTDDQPYHGLETVVWNLMVDHKMTHRTIVSSFHHGYLWTLKQTHPEARLGVLCNHLDPSLLEQARQHGAEAMHVDYTDITEPSIASVQESGLRMNVWTVDHPDDIQRMASWHVDAIITNYPERVDRDRQHLSTAL